MGYVLTTTPDANVKKGIVETSTFVRIEEMLVDTTYRSLFDATIDVTNINTLHTMVHAGNETNCKLKVSIGGDVTEFPITTNTTEYNTLDISSYTGDKELIIAVKADGAATFTKLAAWGTAT